MDRKGGDAGEQNNGNAKSRSALRTQDKQVEPENGTVYFRREEQHPYHRSGKNDPRP